MLKRLVILLLLLVVGCSQVPGTSPNTSVPLTQIAPTNTAKATKPTPAPTKKPTQAVPTVKCDGTLVGGKTPKLLTISLNDLIRCRPEVRNTVEAIQSDGPFRYDQDNTVFTNREGYLPSMAKGSYHEYTVVTPGASTRGTRRIITAGDPNRQPSAFTKLYYTDDHYDTFWQVEVK
jgi:guanyl-specific ribonuclease Sa